MNRTGIIAGNHIRNNIRKKSFLLSYIGLSVFFTAVLVIVFGYFLIRPALETGDSGSRSIRVYFSAAFYAAFLVGVGMQVNVFTFFPLVKEKTGGVITSVLAAPVTPRNLVYGKSLAILIPGWLSGAALSVLSAAGLYLLYPLPPIDTLLAFWPVFTAGVLLPGMYFCFIVLIHIAGLMDKPESSNMMTQIFFPAFSAVMLNLTLRHALDILSWHFALPHLGLALVLLLIVMVLFPALTSEKIVLAPKGGN
jgi:ABC-type Na+ efflux pump permease subunit